jgi:hypothetical protein
MPVDNPGTKRLVFLLWMTVAFFYFYLSYDYVRVMKHDQQFADYLHHAVQLAGTEERAPKEIRALLLVRAEQLSLPIRGEQIAVAGGGQSLSVSVKYDVDIEIPLVQREIYRRRFEHKERFQGPQ